MLDSDILKGLRVRIVVPHDPYKAPSNLTGNPTGPNWSWAIAGYNGLLGGATGTVTGRSASNLNWVVKLDKPWAGQPHMPALTMNAEWLEHENTTRPSAVTLIGAIRAAEAWGKPVPVVGNHTREYDGFCNPQEHPEFSGHCGRLHAHSVGCPTRKRRNHESR